MNKLLKKPAILIISLTLLIIIASILIFSITHFGGQTASDLIFEAVPALVAATVLRLVYFKVNKEPMSSKTKITVVTTYFLLQFVVVIVINLFLIPNENILATLGIQFVIQMVYSSLIYLCLS